MQREGIFVAGHTGDAALRDRGVRINALAFGDYGHGTVLRGFQGERQPGNSAADDDKIVLLHESRRLSINRVWPKNAATAISEFESAAGTGWSVSAFTTST